MRAICCCRRLHGVELRILVPPAPAASEGLDEKQQLVEALQATHWRIYGVHGAAALLGMHPEKLRYRMQKYGLQRPKK